MHIVTREEFGVIVSGPASWIFTGPEVFDDTKSILQPHKREVASKSAENGFELKSLWSNITNGIAKSFSDRVRTLNEYTPSTSTSCAPKYYESGCHTQSGPEISDARAPTKNVFAKRILQSGCA